jgi:transposase
MGITNYVVAPVDMNGKRKNDKNDAAALLAKLDAYVRGNTTAFSIVYVPTPEQEAVRALIRHRYGIARKRAKAAVQGRSVLYHFSLRISLYRLCQNGAQRLGVAQVFNLCFESGARSAANIPFLRSLFPFRVKTNPASHRE